MSIRGSAFSTPWLQFHGVGRADVYIIIRVRASRCGESALNPPTPQHIPRRRPSPTPAQRHALPEHFLTPFPSTSAPPPRADAHPPTSQHIPRRRSAPAPTQRRALPAHFRSPTQPRRTPSRRRRTPADLTTHSRRRSAPTPAQRRALPLPSCHIPAAQTHARRLRYARPPTPQHIPHRRPSPVPTAPPCLPFCSASDTKKRHRTVDVRCRMSRSTVVAVGHWGW